MIPNLLGNLSHSHLFLVELLGSEKLTSIPLITLKTTVPFIPEPSVKARNLL